MKEDLIKRWNREQHFSPEVLEAFLKIPREHFVAEEYMAQAYSDEPLPTLDDQTISQPTTVMVMTSALELKPGHKVLEIGAGSGYQAAIISCMVGKKGKVITMEMNRRLVEFAKNNLKKCRIRNVAVICGDGSGGCRKEAPYDRIIATAACPKIPDAWIQQLKSDGILVAPVGTKGSQEMLRLRKHDGSVAKEFLGRFVFVPLQGKGGY